MKNEKKHWTRWLPWLVTGIMALWIISGLRTAKPKSEYNLVEFSQLPVLLNGRIQPFDSVAVNSLLMLRGKAKVTVAEQPEEELGMKAMFAPKMKAAEWLIEAMTRPEDADKRYIFRIDNQEVVGLLKLPTERKYFSFDELREGWGEVEKQAARIRDQKIKPEVQTPFEKQIVKLQFSLGLYFRIKNTLRPENVPNFTEELQVFKESIAPGLAALRQYQNQQEHSQEDLAMIGRFFRRYEMLSKAAYALVVPPSNPEASRDNWTTIGASLMETLRTGQIQPIVFTYAKVADAYGQRKPAEFNAAVSELKSHLRPEFARELRKGREETFYNYYRPFVKSIAVYLLAFLFGCFYWSNWAPWKRTTAFSLLALALVVHTTGLIFRMYLEGRPPVTNLYSSAIFVGWGAVVLGLILEKFWRDGIGVVTASAVGVVTLIIAHNLSLDGDTMEMLRAVLDTNFWLATHVVVIVLGYSAMFVGGALAIMYILRGVLTKSLSQNTAKALARMVYGVLCFATLFSFVGTILGGIWADQSWGRFWGWDPKENGALMIVIWCAVMLHARWGGLVRDRGLMIMAIVGNIITAFSWFGVNMLGVGLHSYGFMEKAWVWLGFFYLTQLLIMGLGALPLRMWRSFSDDAGTPRKDEGGLAAAKPATA